MINDRVPQFWLLLSFLLFSAAASSQTTGRTNSKGERPKLGLVLSGGGSKGMAHVGVLKVMEEVGLQPDFITGTSMGSIIGGLYAIGYSADSLERLIRSLDWDEVLSDRIPLNKVIFEEKPFFENQLAEFDIKKLKLQVPSGLNQGQQISKLLSRLTMPAIAEPDFSKFPIPYLCNGTDIVSGESVSIEMGDLARAMRTSMAIPTVFTPLRNEGQLLVDGGLVHNFAVREIVDMGADVVIGVYTGREKGNIDELTGLSDLLLQSLFLMGVKDAQAQMDLLDLYIEPDLRNYSAANFHTADSIMHQGELAARAVLPQLVRLADSLQQYGPPRTIVPLPDPEPLVIHKIEVEGNDRISGLEITGRFDIIPGKPVTIDQIEEGIDHIFGTNAFEKVSYRIERSDSLNYLTLEIQEKSTAVLKTAINFDTYHQAGFLVGLIRRNLLLPASRLLVVAKIAENYRFRFNYLKYISRNQRTALAAGFQFDRDRVPILKDGITIQEFRLSESNLDLQWQYRFGQNVMFGIGLQPQRVYFNPTSGVDPGFERLIMINLNGFARLSINSLDRNIFPRKGVLMQAEGKNISNYRYSLEGVDLGFGVDPDSLFDFKPYNKFTMQLDSWIPVHSKASIVLRSFAGYIWNPENTFNDFYLIGSPQHLGRRQIPFLGLKANEQIATAAFGGSLGWQQFVSRNLLLRLEASFGHFEAPKNLQLDGDHQFQLWGLGLTLGYQSFIGPIEFTVSLPLKADGSVQKGVKSFLTIGHRF